MLAARRGLTLPLLPQPSHAYPTGALNLNLPASTTRAYYRDEIAGDGAAPLPTYSVREALKDVAGYNKYDSFVLAFDLFLRRSQRPHHAFDRHIQYPLLAQTQLTTRMPEPKLGHSFTNEQSAVIQGTQEYGFDGHARAE